MFESIYSAIISNIKKSSQKGSGWIIDLVIDLTISISNYNPLAGSSDTKLHKELNHPLKGLINIQILTIMSIVRYLNSVYRKPAIITKADKKNC